jgi:hypothetical protein
MSDDEFSGSHGNGDSFPLPRLGAEGIWLAFFPITETVFINVKQQLRRDQ